MKFSANATSRSGYQAILLAALLSGFLGTASASSKIYLKLEGTDIASDRVPEEWEGWIAGRAFGKGYHSAPQEDVASPAQTVPQLSRTFQVIKHVDKASPLLARAVIDGQLFPTLTAVHVQDGETLETSIRIVLQDVMVTSVKMSGGLLDSVRPSSTIMDHLTEEVTFEYESAEFHYGQPQPESTDNPTDAPFAGIDALAVDHDEDGLPDSYEKAFGLDLQGNDADEDLDLDGLTNGEEFAAGSAPNDRHSRFGIDSIKLMRDNPGRGVVSFRALPGRQYRLLGSPTGQNWFELHAFITPNESEVIQQEIELSFKGLTQLLRVEVSINR